MLLLNYSNFQIAIKVIFLILFAASNDYVLTRILNSSFFLMTLPLSHLVQIRDEALHLIIYFEYLPLSNVHRLLLALYVTVHYFEILLDHLKLYLCPGQLLM